MKLLTNIKRNNYGKSTLLHIDRVAGSFTVAHIEQELINKRSGFALMWFMRDKGDLSKPMIGSCNVMYVWDKGLWLPGQNNSDTTYTVPQGTIQERKVEEILPAIGNLILPAKDLTVPWLKIHDCVFNTDSLAVYGELTGIPKHIPW